ncbi:TetR/AcrR family transcriptional regulator [Duganella aceris]|nr:TetR/AcrR family transcriptional regulator [Duganella aceris]
MAKPTNRDKILSEGLKVVQQYGFGGASVRDIIRAANVPQGSFSNHFESKEAFGVEILDLYFAGTRAVLDDTLCNDNLPPLARLHAYLDANKNRLDRDGMENGCLLGNLGGEAVDHSESIRLRLADIFAEVRQALVYCLNEAIRLGDVPGSMNSEDVAEFIVGGLQGAILMGKVQRSPVPVERFEQILFSMILGQPTSLTSFDATHTAAA